MLTHSPGGGTSRVPQLLQMSSIGSEMHNSGWYNFGNLEVRYVYKKTHDVYQQANSGNCND